MTEQTKNSLQEGKMVKYSQIEHYYRDSADCSTCEISRQWYEEAKAKLAACEDAEEQGRLHIAPCKIKNTVFCIIDTRIYEGYVYCWEIFENKNIVGVLIDRVVRSCAWDKSVFLTRAEAEAALLEREG